MKLIFQLTKAFFFFVDDAQYWTLSRSILVMKVIVMFWFWICIWLFGFVMFWFWICLYLVIWICIFLKKKNRYFGFAFRFVNFVPKGRRSKMG